MHSINKLETAKRQMSSEHKLDKLKKEVMDFVELDKVSFLQSTKTFRTNDAFKMLESLSGRSSFPNEMIYQDRLDGSDMEKVNLFNLFFHSVYMQSSLSVAPIDTQRANIHLDDLVFTISQTIKLLETLPLSSNAVADGIPPFVLKYCSASLGPLIHSLFSRIILTCKWPRLWKCAFVTPIHKKESRNNIENYRPISLLPRLSLVLEKLIFDFLYLRLRYKLNSRQHGFRRGHSTITQLIIYLDELYSNFDDNVEQVLIYLDFAKAFDTVNHAILLEKLALYGLDNNFFKLIFFYLSDRSQRVSVNGTLSDEIMVTSGIPQGSVLGPLLFLVYIDDMLSLPEFSSCFCFADDTKLACAGEDMLSKCQEDLDKLFTWAAENGLTFNVDKCVYLQVSKKCDGGFSIGSNLIRKVDRTSDLGIEISSNLKWNIHVRTKLAKAQRSFNYLRHNVPYSLPNSVKYNLYSACVLSILLYGSQAWFADVSHLRLLENFYWKGLRWCYGRNDYNTLLRASNNTPICYQLI